MLERNILKNNSSCDSCNVYMKFEKHKIGADRYTWRCYNSNCIKYRKRVSIRKDSIFFGLRLKLKKCLRVMLMWLDNDNQSLILKKLKISYSFYRKIVNLLLLKIKSENAISPLKFGGVGTLIQIDETMLNFKCKSHRGRSSRNKSDALCIIEFKQKISKCFACLIPNKKKDTLIPIITSLVIPGSVIYTDEHKSYKVLSKLGYIHKSVCHKKEFINKENGANTQAVECFNNYLKYYIKKKKGVEPQRREDFLLE
ncbi:hypothetical protein H312_02344 [Anncaliia algerae PRA339]|uniref:ISXO2-like transposase domain-containing protein n=1 Tax=Anncaliia algerae PRA339 TaxID=1288291 RepID=A0A059EZT2_9MICR|nr:hypothetical protein H312_02344 [Anncaliia algerae PRA339]